MKILLAFSQDDIYRLFLTFRHNPQNYQKIKEKVIGEGAMQQFKHEMRGRWVFLIAVTFIALVSSLYPMATGDYQSAAAVGVLWLCIVVVFFVWYFIAYQFSFRVLKKNETFFTEFEQKAQQCQVLEEFKNVWVGK